MMDLKNNLIIPFKKRMVKHCFQKILLFSLSLFSFLLLAGEKVNQTINVDTFEIVKIKNNRGKVVVKGWDKKQIKISGELDDLTEKFIFSSNGNITKIQVIIAQENQHLRSGKGSNLKIWVPMDSKVELVGVSASLNASKLNQGLDVELVSGNILLKHVHQHIKVTSISGKVTATNLSGIIKISTVSGAIDIKADSRDLMLKTISSNISAELKESHQVNISTVSGKTRLNSVLANDAQVVLNNISGESYIYSNETINSKVLMEAGAEGKIVNEINDEQAENSSISSKKLLFGTGEKTADIRMFTVNGRVGIKRL